MNPSAPALARDSTLPMVAKIIALLVVLTLITACGKKSGDTAPPAPPAQPEKPSPPPSAAPAAAPAAPPMREPAEAAKAQTTAPAPQSAPAKPAAAERSPEDSAAWQRWERAAERMRDVGGKVRESKDPLRLEVEVGNVTNEAAQSLAANGFRMLGGGGAQVTIFDATGKAIALASAGGVKRP